MSSHDPLVQLRRLDMASPEFNDQLCHIIDAEEYKQGVQKLEGDDLVWFVDYLNKALDCLHPSNSAFRKCLRELRRICSPRVILPTSYTLPPHLLSIGPDPLASRGCGDVYEGTLDDSRVCIKRVRVYAQDGPQKAVKTFCWEAVIPQRNRIVSIAAFDQTLIELPGPCLVVQGPLSHRFESLKHTLSSKSRRRSLYTLPIEQAIKIIDDLEQGSREKSGLCAYHRERFSVMLRKMCREHKLLPSSYITTDEVKTIGESPSGRGGNADVWRGVYLGSKVAVKVLRVPSGVDLTSMERNFCREVVLWKQFRHPNLLPLIGAAKSSYNWMMVSPWMEHGTIMEFIRSCPDTNLPKLLADVARGLKYLHDWPSVHADLKSSNILIDGNKSARIADFGLTSVLRHHSISISMTAPAWGGTIRWMAPELYDEKSSPSKESDIYALGMVVYEVFAHDRPFTHFRCFVVPHLVLSGERPSRPSNREILGLSDELWALTKRCWDKDPSVRPHVADVLSHFEAASSGWTPSTPEAIASLGLDRPATKKPPMTESTSTMSEAVLGDDRTGSGDQNVVGNPHEAWGLSNGTEWFTAATTDLGSAVHTLEEFRATSHIH